MNLLSRLKEQVTPASSPGILRRARSAALRLAGFPRPAVPAGDNPACTFDLGDRRATSPPFPALTELRLLGDVHFLPKHGCWIVLGYDTVRDALGRPALFSSSPQNEVDTVLLGADPPDHDAMRRLVAGHMTSATIARLVAAAREDAGALIQPEFDLVGGYAAPLARRAAARLVGLDEAEMAALLAAPDIQLPLSAMAPASRLLLLRSDLFEALRRDGAGEPAALSLVRLLCRAATETTERLILRAGAALLGDPELRSTAGENPAAMAALIDEVARLLPPEPVVVRRMSGEGELAGVSIPQNSVVFLSLLAANRDPRRFETPDALRLDRPRNPHLAFSGGPHHCIGAGLARQLVAAALTSLVEQGVRAADPGAVPDLAVVQGIATPRRLMVCA